MKQIATRTERSAQRRGSRQEFWREMLRRYAAGGQSVRVFCRARGLSEPSFYAWRRRLAQDGAAASAAADMPAFVPVRVRQEDVPGMRGIEIVLHGDRRIRLSGPVDKAALAEVVAVLEGLPATTEPVQQGGGQC